MKHTENLLVSVKSKNMKCRPYTIRIPFPLIIAYSLLLSNNVGDDFSSFTLAYMRF
jgi:hypothetical protein